MDAGVQTCISLWFRTLVGTHSGFQKGILYSFMSSGKESALQSPLSSNFMMKGHKKNIRYSRQSENCEYNETPKSCRRRMDQSIHQLKSSYEDLLSSTRFSRHSPTQHPKNGERPSQNKQVEIVVAELKQKYSPQTRLSRLSNLTKMKSELSLLAASPTKKQLQKKRNLLNQLQQKITQYNKNNRLISARSKSKLIQIAKSLERNSQLNEKTQKCKQLCLQIKRKLFKETMSTTTERGKPRLEIGDFAMMRVIGEGKFSRVYVARHRGSGVVVAVKVIRKDTIRKERFQEQLAREIKLQSFLNHLNIVKLYSFFHDAANVYLLLEYCEGGQLYDIFRSKSRLREAEWQPLMRGVCEGLYDLHHSNIIHRDLKPENIVLSFALPKIADFGWSVYTTASKRDTFCGTPLYISPELLLGNSYDKQVDIWALGVMMYEFLTGRIPFKLQQEKNLLEIVNSNIAYPSYLGDQCIDLLRMILEKDPLTRIGIMDILDHPFLNANLQNSSSPSKAIKFSR